MKIWNGLVIAVGIASLVLAGMGGSGEGLIAATVLISGGSIAMSITCLGQLRQKGTEKKTEE
jgi:hypothetical protein